MEHDNEGVARLISGIRSEAEKVINLKTRSNFLGTMTSGGVYVDSIEDEIPRSDFLFLVTEIGGGDPEKPTYIIKPKTGDRVLCVPVGDYYVVLGKVE